MFIKFTQGTNVVTINNLENRQIHEILNALAGTDFSGNIEFGNALARTIFRSFPAPLPQFHYFEVMETYSYNEKIKAVKYLREIALLGLRDACDVIDRIQPYFKVPANIPVPIYLEKFESYGYRITYHHTGP